jgi:hypothetical protein
MSGAYIERIHWRSRAPGLPTRKTGYFRVACRAFRHDPSGRATRGRMRVRAMTTTGHRVDDLLRSGQLAACGCAPTRPCPCGRPSKAAHQHPPYTSVNQDDRPCSSACAPYRDLFASLSNKSLCERPAGLIPACSVRQMACGVRRAGAKTTPRQSNPAVGLTDHG